MEMDFQISKKAILGTDPENPDTDGDGVNDYEDAFPSGCEILCRF
jgi:hypothetical protein